MQSQELSAPGPTTPLSAPVTTALIIPPNHLQFPFLPALASPPTLDTAPSHNSYTKAGGYGEYTPYSDYNYPGEQDPGGEGYPGGRWAPVSPDHLTPGLGMTGAIRTGCRMVR